MLHYFMKTATYRETMKKPCIIIFCVIILIFSVSFVNAGQKSIRILHVNDFHGFAEPYKPFGSDEMLGGIANLAARINTLRNERPSLLIAAGDMIQGNNWANLSQGESVIEAMNAMGFDAMVVGNHEFDFGPDVLRKRILEANFPVLGANIKGMDAIMPYAIRKIMGIKIAIIGVVTEDTPIFTHPRNVSGLTFFPVKETVDKYVRELRGGADIVILLTHTGHQADRLLAEKNTDIDIIVGGHSHTKISQPVLVNNTLIVQAWEHAKALGVLDLTIENGKITKFDGHLEEIKPGKGGENTSVSEIVKRYNQRANAVLDEKIGVAEVDLDGENVRKKETNLGNFIADIMKEVSNADATIINGGGIRTSIKKGEIKVKHVYSVLPFDNYIVAVRLTGDQIRNALEYGVSSVESGEGRFPQVSGIFFQYRPAEPAGNRIKDIYIAGKLLEAGREYIIATNDFLAAGGDGYKAFGDAIKSSKDFSITGGTMLGDKLVYNNPGKWLRDVVIEHIKNNKKISPLVKGRILEIR